MMCQEYLFEIQGSLCLNLRSQADEFSDLISEVWSRKQLPKLWKLADRINAIPKASPETLQKWRKYRTVLGVIELLLALFGLGPALVAPEELLPVLLIGTLCLGTGIASLWTRHRILLAVILILTGIFYGTAGLGGGEEFRRLLIFGVGLLVVAVAALFSRGRKRDRKAKQDIDSLFDARQSMREGDHIYIRFTEQGMETFTEEEPGRTIPYDALLGILETEDLLLIVVEKQGFLLAKSELKTGTFSDLKAELSAKVLWLTKKGMN